MEKVEHTWSARRGMCTEVIQPRSSAPRRRSLLARSWCAVVVELGIFSALNAQSYANGDRFDASATSYGTGLPGIADRLDAIGGSPPW